MQHTFEADVKIIQGKQLIKFDAATEKILPSRGLVMVRLEYADQWGVFACEPDGQKGHFFDLDAVLEGTGFQNLVFPLQMGLEVVDDWVKPQIPQDIKACLVEADLMSYWDTITPKAQWDWCRWIGATKSEATRFKRMHVMLDKFMKGDRRPCCFNTAACTDMSVSKSGILMDS